MADPDPSDIRILRGRLTPEELAALTVVLAARAASLQASATPQLRPIRLRPLPAYASPVSWLTAA